MTTVAITSNGTTIDDGNVEVGFWILGGMLVYLVVILIFVLWCLNSRKGATCCNCEVGRVCQGQCECLEVRITNMSRLDSQVDIVNSANLFISVFKL